MSPKAMEQVLSEFDSSRRDFLRKVALTTAWAAPFVASFSIDGLGLQGAVAGAGNILCSNITMGSNVTEMRIQKTVSPAQVAPGGTVTYTIHVANCFALDAGNVSMQDTLPAEMGFVGINQLAGQAPDSMVLPPVGSTGSIVLSWAVFTGPQTASFEVLAVAL
jgi:uncharacterized repeat protein (TIGR01451 family)